MSARTEPRTGYRHSQQCWDIGPGPGHEACICRCHETMSARDIMLDDPDWHAAACAYDGGEIECDCLLPDRLSAIEAEAGPSRGPDLSALDAEIARREAPDYQRFHKPSESQTPAERTGATAVRGIQHGELIGLRLARHLLEYAALDKESEPAR